MGVSNRYCHQRGLRLPNFKHGCDFLLPLDVFLKVNSKEWESDIRKLNPKIDMNARSRRKPLPQDDQEGVNSEKVKVGLIFSPITLLNYFFSFSLDSITNVPGVIEILLSDQTNL